MIEESDKNLDAIVEKIVSNTKKYFKSKQPGEGSLEHNLKLWLAQSEDYQGTAFETTVGGHLTDKSKVFPFFFDIFCTIFSDSPSIFWKRNSDHVRWLTNLIFNLPSDFSVQKLVDSFLDPITQKITNKKCSLIGEYFIKEQSLLSKSVTQSLIEDPFMKKQRENLLSQAVALGLYKRAEKEKEQEKQLQSFLDYYIPIAIQKIKSTKCEVMFGKENCTKAAALIKNHAALQIAVNTKWETWSDFPKYSDNSSIKRYLSTIHYVIFSKILEKIALNLSNPVLDDDALWVQEFYEIIVSELKISRKYLLALFIQHYLGNQAVFESKIDGDREYLTDGAKIATATIRVLSNNKNYDYFLKSLLEIIPQKINDDVLSIMIVGLLYNAQDVRLVIHLLQMLKKSNHNLYKSTKRWAQQNGYDMKVFVEEADKSLPRRYLLYILTLLGLSGAYILAKKKKFNITVPQWLNPWLPRSVISGKI